MKKIFIEKYDFYKDLINDLIQNLPNKGRGEFNKLSEYLNVHSTLMSHIFKGDKHLTLEQAFLLCDYFSFDENEKEYFILLVQEERSGTISLKNYFKQKRVLLKEKALQVEKKIKAKNELNETDQYKFYSQWHYSAIRLLTSIEKYQNKDELAKKINIPLTVIEETLHFLVNANLIKNEGTKFKIGAKRTHIGIDSPLIWTHHKNWRLKAMERHGFLNSKQELFFTSPLTISHKDLEQVRELALDFIEKVKDIVETTEPETLAVLNIDWAKLF